MKHTTAVWFIALFLLFIGFSVGTILHAYATDTLKSEYVNCDYYHKNFDKCVFALESCEGEVARNQMKSMSK